MSLVICSMKDEASYLLEWIAYHSTIGFEEVLIVSNNNSDLSIFILEALSQEFSWIHYLSHGLETSGLAPQVQAYQLALIWLKNNRMGVIAATIDADEFLYPMGTSSPIDIFESFDADAIFINWRIFGSSGNEVRRHGLVIDRFDHCSKVDFWQNRNFKSMFRVNEDLNRIGVHFPSYRQSRKARYVSTSGAFVDPADLREKPYSGRVEPFHGLIQLNHYAVKSSEEFQARRIRGRGAAKVGQATNKTRHNQRYFTMMDRNEIFSPMPTSVAMRVRKKMIGLYEGAFLGRFCPPEYFGL